MDPESKKRRVVGNSFNAVVSGRHGVEGRFQSGHFCVLGELGRFHANDFPEAPDVATAFVQGTRPHPWNLRHWSQQVTEVGNMWFRPRWSTSTERKCLVVCAPAPERRSQAGPGGGLALSAVPTYFLTRIPSHLAHMPVWPPRGSALEGESPRCHGA